MLLEKTGQSPAFKSTYRSSAPTWSNRFRKDVNDLNYQVKDLRDVQYSLKKRVNVLKKPKLSSSSPIVIAMNKYKHAPDSKRSGQQQKIRKFDAQNYGTQHSIREQNPNKFLQTQTTFGSVNSRNPEASPNPKSNYSSTLNIMGSQPNGAFSLGFVGQRQSMNALPKSHSQVGERQIERGSDRYGLCEFQFANATTEGKIQSMKGYNLSLQKCKTQRTQNERRLWYDKDTELEFHFQNKKEQVLKLGRYRDFSLCKGHQLYDRKLQVGNGGLLDKFYTVDNTQLEKTRKKGQTVSIEFQKSTSRPEIVRKEGTHLEYHIEQRGGADWKKPLFELQRVPRTLKISRQVINDERGCFR